MEGDRLIHTALLILRGTTRAQQDYGPTAVSIALSVPHSTSVVTATGQSGRLEEGCSSARRAPSSCNDRSSSRSSPPGMDIKWKSMSTPWVIIAVNFCASNHNGRRQAHPVRRGTLIAWGGDRLTPLAAGRDRFARHNGRHTRIVGAKTRECVSCFSQFTLFWHSPHC